MSPAAGRPRLRIKLCGVRRPQDAELCADAGADEVGVVFAPSSRRCVTLATARMVRDALPPDLRLVGVFLDAAAAQIEEALGQVKLDAVQLHGSLPQRLPAGVEVYVALHVGKLGDLARIRELPFASRVLLDSPRGGGSGAIFDWSLARAAREHGPRSLFIAGGLTPDNVSEAVRLARPDGVDVATGIEGADGFKDPGRVRAFVRAVKEAAP